MERDLTQGKIGKSNFIIFYSDDLWNYLQQFYS